MSRKSGIANYGYRDQNDFQSSIGLVCEAITNSSSSSDKDIIKQLVESVNLIFNKAIVDAKYNTDNKEYEFNNYYGAEVDRFKFPYLIDTAEYDADTKNIIIKFEDETVEPIEIDLSAIGVSGDIETELAEEISARTKADQDIWDAIGDLSGSTETSGKTLLELIEEEASARTANDEQIEYDLGEETDARVQGDSDLLARINDEKFEREADVEELWNAMGSGSSVIEIINEEISARTSADTELWEAVNILADNLNEEISARTINDEQLENSIGEEISARTQGDDELSSRIDQEINDRQTVELEIINELSAETEARISGDAELTQKIADEKAARIYWFNQLSGAVTTEKTEREGADAELWEALSAETEARKSADDVVSGVVDTERVERIAADEMINNALDAEKTERAATDNEISGKVETEKADRISADIAISDAIEEEKTQRIAADEALNNAIEAEKSQRISEDDFLSGAILDNQVHVERKTTDLEANVKEEYFVVNNKGEILGQHIKIYKDSSLLSVELVHTGEQGQSGQFLKFTYLTATGTRDIVFIDVSEFLAESEFKDGLIVNRSGEVRILIDRASNPYLTVSEDGLKLTGVTEIESSLETEISTRQTDVARIEANLEEEIATRQTVDMALSGAIATEKEARENADSSLETLINHEKARAESAENVISYGLTNEKINRENADQQLNNDIITLSTRLSTETTERTSEDTLIRSDIAALRSDYTALGQRVDTVNDRVTAEVDRARTEEQALQTALNTKADAANVYYKDQVDAIFATKEEIPTDFYSRNDVDAKDDSIRVLITAETATREAEDADLNRAITSEVQRAMAVEDALSGNIDTIRTELSGKVVDVSSDLTITVDKTDAIRPNLSVNVSSEENQIIKVNADGIYAKSKLGYDEEHNILIYTNTTGTTTIALKTKSEIDRIYYDKPNERIVIEYTVNGSRKEDVYVPVHDLIEEWRTEDGNVGAIALSKDISIPEADVLKARLILNTAHGDNAAIIDDNALYVSKNAIVAEANAEIEALKARVAALENALSAATEVHSAHENRITQVEQVNAIQTDEISEINTKNQSQDDAIAQLQSYAEDEP